MPGVADLDRPDVAGGEGHGRVEPVGQRAHQRELLLVGRQRLGLGQVAPGQRRELVVGEGGGLDARAGARPASARAWPAPAAAPDSAGCERRLRASSTSLFRSIASLGRELKRSDRMVPIRCGRAARAKPAKIRGCDRWWWWALWGRLLQVRRITDPTPRRPSPFAHRTEPPAAPGPRPAATVSNARRGADRQSTTLNGDPKGLKREDMNNALQKAPCPRWRPVFRAARARPRRPVLRRRARRQRQNIKVSRRLTRGRALRLGDAGARQAAAIRRQAGAGAVSHQPLSPARGRHARGLARSLPAAPLAAPTPPAAALLRRALDRRRTSPLDDAAHRRRRSRRQRKIRRRSSSPRVGLG